MTSTAPRLTMRDRHRAMTRDHIIAAALDKAPDGPPLL